jgi:hypothetical protein
LKLPGKGRQSCAEYCNSSVTNSSFFRFLQ